MDLGFSPHLLAYVSYSPPSTRLKDRDALNLSYGSNLSYHTPVSKNVHSVRESQHFMSFNFSTEQSQNKTKKETDRKESAQSLRNSKINSPISHEDFMICSSEDEFSPFLCSSPNLVTSKTIKTSQNIRSTIGELELFASNSNLQNPKNNSPENSTIFENDSVNFLNQGFDDGNSQNSGDNSFEDETFFENDSLKILNTQPLKPLQSFYETKEISRQLSFSENISLYPVFGKPGVLGKCFDVLELEPAVLSATSCTYVPVSSNADNCILRSTEHNEISYQVNANEPNNLPNTFDFFQATENLTEKKNLNIHLPSNKPFRKQFFESSITILKTPERRCSILNVKSEDTFEIPTQKSSVGGCHNSEFDIKYDRVSLKNMTGVLQNSANSFEFENKYMNTILEEDFTLFRNNEYHRRPVSVIRTEVAETFHNYACDSTLGNMGIEFHPANTSNVIPENVCGSKCRSNLRDSWNIDGGISASDQIITAASVRENMNFEHDLKLCCKDSRFHAVNNANVVSENICGVKYRCELINPLKTDCGIPISDKAVTASSIRENLDVENVSGNLCTTDQIIACRYIDQLGEQMTPIHNIKSPESKIRLQIYDDSFMKEESLLRNEFSSHIFTGVVDRTFCSVESLRTEQTSLQVVSYCNKTLQASTASTLELSSNLDFIGKRQDFDYLELSARNTDMMFEGNNGKYPLNERDAKSITTSTKKCITFPSISKHQAKDDEFAVRKKEISYNDSTFKSKIDENQECSSEVDFDDFVSAPEYYSSSSEVFYDMEEFYDTADSGSSEKENYCVENVKNCVVETPFSDFKNKSILQDGRRNRCKSQTSSATKNNTTSDLFNSNEPVIIKYINEHTQQIEEMLIYPIEYHEKLSRKIGRKSINREEILDKLIERSKVYVGKPVGIILNIKDIRKKNKTMPEERGSSAEKFKEKNSGVNILTIEQSLTDCHNANSFSGCASSENIHYNEQIVRNCEEGHHMYEDSYASEQSLSDFHNANSLTGCTSGGNIHYDKQIVRNCEEGHHIYEDSYTHTVSCLRKSLQNDTGIRKDNVQPEDAYAYTVSCARKLQKNETVSCADVLPEEDDMANTCYSKICNHPTISYNNSAVRLTENMNVYSNDQKAVVSSICEYKSQKGCCFPSPIQRRDAVFSKSTSYCQEDKLKRWLHVGKQPLKSVLNSCSTANSRKPCTISIHSTKQREFGILRKVQSTDNFTKCPMKPCLFKLKGNLMHHSDDYSSSQAIQKYDSFSNKHLNNSQEKWPKKMVSPSKKRINIDEIISSDFKTYFHSYAKRGGRLKSGSVISKSNSNYWLKKAGVIYDEKSRKIADESFAEVARKKIVLNICDYVQYLIILSRREKICLGDLLQQLKTADISGSFDSKKRMDSTVSNLSGDRSFKSNSRCAKQLEKTSLQVPERFSHFPLSSTPRRTIARI